MPQSFASLYCHIVFGVKNRARQLTDELRHRMHPFLGGILRSLGGKLMSAGGVEDHVHLLVSLDRQRALSDVVREIKAGSSRWIHDSFPKLRDFAWQDGFGAFSVSLSAVPEVTRYIERQREHHKHKTFREEFVAFLVKHGIPFDERYLIP